MARTGRRRDGPPGILLVGPMGSGGSATNVIGGNRMLVAESARELAARGFATEIVDTSGSVANLPAWRIRAARLARLLRALWAMARKARRHRIVLVVMAPYSALVLGTCAWAVCAALRRPLAIRFSGSGLPATYGGYPAPARRLADRTWMRCARVYVETRSSRRAFRDRANFRWLPNTRDVRPPPRPDGPEIPREMVFVSRLEMDKGLAEALEACRNLPDDCRLDVYGPPVSDTDMSLFADHPRAEWRGVLALEEVAGVLARSDLLLFPSYCRREGYPGVVLEAFQCGAPVVAARWGGVPELVRHEENGLLVEPRSAAAVERAIVRLRRDPALYRRLRAGAARRGERFRSGRWLDPMAADLRRLISESRRSD